jgi:hypothetical protein
VDELCKNMRVVIVLMDSGDSEELLVCAEAMLNVPEGILLP